MNAIISPIEYIVSWYKHLVISYPIDVLNLSIWWNLEQGWQMFDRKWTKIYQML